MHLSTFLLSLVLISLVDGHARIKHPRPLSAAPDSPSGNYYNNPLRPDGSDFPCKGLHKRAGVDKSPTETWRAGEETRFEILGHGPYGGEGSLAAHSGGSCQASISFDDGETWKVLHTYHGGCPRGARLGSNMASSNQTFKFRVPAETRAGNVLFSWSWIAVTGNRNEFYQNCASVRIEGPGTSTLEHLPDMFVGDMTLSGHIGAGECRSTANYAVTYPFPGDAVTVTPVDNIPFKAPTRGKCFTRNSKSNQTGNGSVPSDTTLRAVTTTIKSTPSISTSTIRANPSISTSTIRSASEPTTTIKSSTTNSLVSTTSRTGPMANFPIECENYRLITDASRQKNHADAIGCDKSIFSDEPTWVRFSGAAGTRLASGPISGFKCGTQGTGWYSGQYPSSKGQTTTGKVCFGWPNAQCHWSTTISITNCNDYFVFALRAPPACYLRYCTA